MSDPNGATAAAYRETALRKAELLRKKLRKEAKRLVTELDVRNKFSLPDADAAALVPRVQSVRSVVRQATRKNTVDASLWSATSTSVSSPASSSSAVPEWSTVRKEWEGALRIGRGLARDLANLEQNRPLQLLLLKCAVVIADHYVQRHRRSVELETQRKTQLIMSLPMPQRDNMRRREIELARQRAIVARDKAMLEAMMKRAATRAAAMEAVLGGSGKKGDGTRRIPKEMPELHPIVADLEVAGRFTFGDLIGVFPITAHGSAHALGLSVQRLEAQKLIIRDHDRGMRDAHLKSLPLTADVPPELLHSGRRGLRQWLDQVYGSKNQGTVEEYMHSFGTAGIRDLWTLSRASGEHLAEIVSNPSKGHAGNDDHIEQKIQGEKKTKKKKKKKKKKKPSRSQRRQAELLSAVARLRIGIRGDYDIERRAVRFRFSRRTGAVLYTMMMRVLSAANSINTPGGEERCSGCQNGTLAHVWDCGSSQLDLLRQRHSQVLQRNAHQPLRRSDDGDMPEELTWYEALRRRLHLERGWGFGADPRKTVVPTITRSARQYEASAAVEKAAARSLFLKNRDWVLKRHKELRAGNSGADNDSDNKAQTLEERFLASPRVRGIRLGPTSTTFDVCVKPATAKGCCAAGSKNSGIGALLSMVRDVRGSVFVSESQRVILGLDVQHAELRTKASHHDAHFSRVSKTVPTGSMSSACDVVKGAAPTRVARLPTLSSLEFAGPEVIGSWEHRLSKSVSFGEIHK